MFRADYGHGKVNVLMSTYNGVKYLPEQLNSLATQDYRNLVVHIRDDCSNDNTFDIAADYCRQRKKWNVRKGAHLGVFGSFMDLLRHADSTATYFAFCDQDDIWLSDKVSRAVSFLERHRNSYRPLLYCSRVHLVDSSLRSIGATRIPSNISFENAVVENVATGCTIVIDRKARDLLLERIPDNLTFHDWWAYLVISVFGTVIYDSEPRVLHRKHSGNVSLDLALGLSGVTTRIQKILSTDTGNGPLTTRLNAFFYHWQDRLSDECRETLGQFTRGVKKGLCGRTRLAFTHPYRRNLMIDQTALTMMILLGKY